MATNLRSMVWLLPAAFAIPLTWIGTSWKSTLLSEAIFNCLHAPFFGLVAVGVLNFAYRKKVPRPYLLAWTFALVLGVVTETLQYFGPRNASLSDVALNTLGASAFLLFAFVAREVSTGAQTIRSSLGGPLALGAILIGLAFYPVLSTAAAYIYRDKSRPVICSFESRLSRRFTQVKDAEMVVTSAPMECGDCMQGKVAKIVLTEMNYSGFGIGETFPDWTGYEYLAFELYSESAGDTELVLRIHDRTHDQSFADRFNRTIQISAGCNSIRCLLSDVRHAPREREMDMKQVRGLVLFAADPTERMSFYLDSFRLE